MKVLDLDDEQGAMILVALRASNALLEARFHRMDPDGILSNSFMLQKRKIEQIEHQMAGGEVAQWKDLTIDAKDEVLRMIDILALNTQEGLRATAYTKLLHFMLGQRKEGPVPALTIQG